MKYLRSFLLARTIKHAGVPRLAVVFSVVILAVMGCSKELSEEQLLERAIEHQRNNEFDDALENFKMLIERFPKSPNVPEALYAMGVIYEENKRDYTKAISTYKKILDEHPDHDTAPGAAYHRALLLRRDLGNLKEAQEAYEEFLKRYPTAATASSAKSELDSIKSDLRKKK